MDDGVTLKTYTFHTPPTEDPLLSQRFKVALEKYEAAARVPFPISK